mgnify:CR=1 FL=1
MTYRTTEKKEQPKTIDQIWEQIIWVEISVSCVYTLDYIGEKKNIYQNLKLS